MKRNKATPYDMTFVANSVERFTVGKKKPKWAKMMMSIATALKISSSIMRVGR